LTVSLKKGGRGDHTGPTNNSEGGSFVSDVKEITKKSKTKAKKINFKAIAASDNALKELYDDPKTLAEIHREVGFPFSAKAVCPSENKSIYDFLVPDGRTIYTEKFARWPNKPTWFQIELDGVKVQIDPNVRRWILIS
jgi:hypothetical protein